MGFISRKCRRSPSQCVSGTFNPSVLAHLDAKVLTNGFPEPQALAAAQAVVPWPVPMLDQVSPVHSLLGAVSRRTPPPWTVVTVSSVTDGRILQDSGRYVLLNSSTYVPTSCSGMPMVTIPDKALVICLQPRFEQNTLVKVLCFGKRVMPGITERMRSSRQGDDPLSGGAPRAARLTPSRLGFFPAPFGFLPDVLSFVVLCEPVEDLPMELRWHGGVPANDRDRREAAEKVSAHCGFNLLLLPGVHQTQPWVVRFQHRLVRQRRVCRSLLLAVHLDDGRRDGNSRDGRAVAIAGALGTTGAVAIAESTRDDRGGGDDWRGDGDGGTAGEGKTNIRDGQGLGRCGPDGAVTLDLGLGSP